MQREIQRNLFQSDLSQGSFVEEKKSLEHRAEGPVKAGMEEQKAMQEQLYKMANHMNEQLKNQHLKFEKLAQALHRLELSQSGMIHETAEKMAQLASKVAERKAVDFRIQELIDRHNTVLQTYELRLANLQKVISEKEANILSLKAYLNEARADLARLKR